MSDTAPNKLNRWRYLFVLFLMLGVGIFLFYRALNIQVLDNDFLKDQGDARHLRTIDLPAHRGMILDRHGEVLAMSTPVATVWANPKVVLKNGHDLQQVAKLIGQPLAVIQKKLQERPNKAFVYLGRRLNPSLADSIRQLKIPGVSTLREFRRYYPAGEVTAHVVGYTDIDDGGIEGFELQANADLKGIPGKDKVIKDRLGRIVDSVAFIKAPQAGQNIHLSIDKRLQYIAYRELNNAMVQHKAKSASLVILDVHTGEVLAMVNLPAFNPNEDNKRHRPEHRNLSVTDVFEPGSTIKPFIIAAALKTKQFDSHSLINTAPGSMRVGRERIRDVSDYGELDFTGIIKKSSNVGVVKIALQMDKYTLWESLSDFGFGEKTGSRITGEQAGRLPFFGNWTTLTQAILSFGYGVSSNALQLAQSYALLANGGYLKPVSMYRLDSAPKGQSVLDEEIAFTVLAMMETVVSREGTAAEAAIPGYRVAGKTGTMKKLGPNGYLDDKHFAVFAGIAPVSQPRLVGIVLFDEPSNGEYYGGKVAAPVFSRVMAEALRLQNVAPDNIEKPLLRVAGLEVQL